MCRRRLRACVSSCELPPRRRCLRARTHLESPRMMTLRRIFLRCDMAALFVRGVLVARTAVEGRVVVVVASRQAVVGGEGARRGGARWVAAARDDYRFARHTCMNEHGRRRHGRRVIYHLHYASRCFFCSHRRQRADGVTKAALAGLLKPPPAVGPHHLLRLAHRHTGTDSERESHHPHTQAQTCFFAGALWADAPRRSRWSMGGSCARHSQPTQFTHSVAAPAPLRCDTTTP